VVVVVVCGARTGPAPLTTILSLTLRSLSFFIIIVSLTLRSLSFFYYYSSQ
jgi:hypothetical protein